MYDKMYSDTTDEKAEPTFAQVGRSINERDRSGLSVSFDALTEELNTTADLVSNLFHRLDPILFREGADLANPGTRPESNGSQVQEAVWEKTAMVNRINNQLRELSSRIDV